MKLSKDLFEKYANLKIEAKAIDSEIKKIQPLLVKEMEDADKEEVESDAGKFIFSYVPIWTYPKEIVELEERLKEMKTAAQRKGTATHTDRKDFKFNPLKEKNE